MASLLKGCVPIFPSPVLRPKSNYDIIIPIYNGYKFVKECLSSIKEHTPCNHRVVLINDCSTDDELNDYLADYVRENQEVVLIENSENLGFVKSCNKGMQLSDRDVILLNSDTLVTEGWIDRLHACVNMKPDIGIVSPLFNNATILSIPWSMANNTIETFKPCDFASIVAMNSARTYPDIPTAVGACMLIKREVIDRIGYFDEIFGLGYGEENDFCMRALKAGWKTVACDDAFVYHHGKYSFSLVDGVDEKIKKNTEMLNKKHPEYMGLVRDFIEKNPLGYMQKAFCRSIIDQDKKSLLFLLHSFEKSAGVELHANDLIGAFKKDYNVVVFYPNRAKPDNFDYTLTRDGIHCVKVPYSQEIFSLNNPEIERIFRSVLDNFNVGLLHVQHMQFLPFSLIHTAKESRLPVILTLHDFFYLCDEHNLYNFKKKVCKKTYFSGNGMCEECLAEKYGIYNEHLCSRSSTVLNALVSVDVIISPSEFLRKRYETELPELKGKIRVIGHGIDTQMYDGLEKVSTRKVTVGLIGNLTDRKGLHVFLDSLKELTDINAEFHLHGDLCCDAAILKQLPVNVIWHGPYRRDEIPHILSGLDIVVIPSIVEESFCYTLSEAFASKTPVVAARSGALAERIKDKETGILYEATHPSELANAIRLIVADQKLYERIKTNLTKIRERSIEDMTEDYKMLYSAINKKALNLSDALPSVFFVGHRGKRTRMTAQSAYQINRLLQSAREHEKAGDIKNSIESYKKIIEIFPYHFDALLLLGKLFLSVRDYEAAEEILTRLIKTYPSVPEGYLYLGLALLQKKKYDNVVQVMKDAIDRAFFSKDQKVIIYEYIGEAYLFIGNYEEARTYFEKALICNEWAYKGNYGMGQICFQKGDYEGSFRYLEKAVRISPNYAPAVNLLRMLKNRHTFQNDKAVESAFGKKSEGHSYEVSIIIPVYNKVEYTQECLVALSQNTDGIGYEVIIIDNGSTDGTKDILKNLSGDVKVLINYTNLGFAKACNQGAEIAQGKYLVFLNNATIPQKGWLSEMLKALDHDPKVAIVGSKLIYPDTGLIQHAGIVFSDLREPYHIYKNLASYHPAVNRLEEFQAVTGACMLIDKEVFTKVGMFDEAYINGYEDIDLCLKVREAGYKIIYTPNSVLYHDEFTSEGITDFQYQNLNLFLKKWKQKIVPDEKMYYAKNGYKIVYDSDDKRKFSVYQT